MARLGLDHPVPEEYAVLLVELLDSGTAYEAHLALTGAGTVQDAQAVKHALKHCKARVRGRAAWMLAELITDSGYPVEDKIVSMSHQERQLLLRSIVKHNRQDWAERLLQIVLERWGAKEAAILLPMCSEETVRTRLPQLGYALRNWRLLSTRYPDQAAAYLNKVLSEASDSGKSGVWYLMSTAVEKLSVFRPGMILEYALKYGPKELIHPVIKEQLGILIQTSPERVFELLTREESRAYLLNNGVPAGVLKKKMVHLCALDCAGEAAGCGALSSGEGAGYTCTFQPGALFEAAYPEQERKLRMFPMSLLDVLPHQLRDQEAARMLHLRDAREDRGIMLELTARRMIDAARETLELSVQASSADERAIAYARLIQSTALSRSGMGRPCVS